MIAVCDRKLKLVRTEYGYSQERMAAVLGLSKKTLLEVEKGRATLGWTGTAAVCGIFRDSEVLSAAFGGAPDELVRTLALDGFVARERPASGLFWVTEEEFGGYRLVQNVISQHYRLYSPDGELLGASFDPEELKKLTEGIRTVKRDG